MTTTLTPLDIYRERIPVARAAFDAAFGLMPVPQRRRDMARRLWQQVHAQVPEMPEPKVVVFDRFNSERWDTDDHVGLVWLETRYAVEVNLPSVEGGYELWCWDRRSDVVHDTAHTYSIEPLLRVCQRFVTATAREVR